MNSIKVALVGLVALVMVGCNDSNDVTTTEQMDFAYSGSIEGQIFDTVYMSHVTYQITVNLDGYTYGEIMFGSAVIEEFVGTTTSDGNFTAVNKYRKLNDLGKPVVSPIVMDGTMVSSNGVLVGGSGHWYSDDKIGNWSTK